MALEPAEEEVIAHLGGTMQSSSSSINNFVIVEDGGRLKIKKVGSSSANNDWYVTLNGKYIEFRDNSSGHTDKLASITWN